MYNTLFRIEFLLVAVYLFLCCLNFSSICLMFYCIFHLTLLAYLVFVLAFVITFSSVLVCYMFGSFPSILASFWFCFRVFTYDIEEYLERLLRTPILYRLYVCMFAPFYCCLYCVLFGFRFSSLLCLPCHSHRIVKGTKRDKI